MSPPSWPACLPTAAIVDVAGIAVDPCWGRRGLFFANVGLGGGPTPVRQFLPDLLDRVWRRRIDPGKVFDMTLPLDQVGDGYGAIDERRAIKVLLRA